MPETRQNLPSKYTPGAPQVERKRPRKLEIRRKPDEGHRASRHDIPVSKSDQNSVGARKRPTKLRDSRAQQIPAPEQADEAVKAAESAKAVTLAQRKAAELKAGAEHVADPAERERLLSAAVQSQKKALAENETVQKLQKGTTQGAGAGGGIGLATGAGVGTAVGTVVGVPTTALGAGVGAGVGALHGPFVKITDDDE
ncbi:MAG: hypothetical protein M1821_005360 [Bathelium mastoideum]|nr:MAG: hypothetical protein M1821_005360 [Bathelium mastoideum]